MQIPQPVQQSTAILGLAIFPPNIMLLHSVTKDPTNHGKVYILQKAMQTGKTCP
jgi:hypothetical protein